MENEPRLSANLASTPGALIKLGCALVASGKGDRAVAMLRKLLADRPDDPELASAAQIILSHRIPSWHGAMLSDSARNDGFEAAIGRAVTPGATVLDIGTGSGLLAMMAARAGAGRVVACEAEPALAATAREIVEKNGYSAIIEVLAKRSTDLDREADLGGGADVIVAEVFADDLLYEGAVQTLRHARRELARPGARFIPASASVRVALGERTFSSGSGHVKGFDLSLFRRHLASNWKLSVGDKSLRLSSQPLDLFSFDFEAGDIPVSGRIRLTMAAEDEEANGLVQWLRLRLDSETDYENKPAPGGRSHWSSSFYPFPDGRRLRRGESIEVNAAHDGERLQIWVGE